MTHNIFVKCDVCESILNLKWQVGYLPKSIFRISCGKCKTSIEGVLYTNNRDASLSYEIINAKEIEPKLEFYCDYIIPISGELLTEKIRNGEENFKPTPFMNLVNLVGIENFSIFNERFLRGIERIKTYKKICDRLNELYINKEYNYLKSMLKEDFNINIKKLDIKKLFGEKYKIDFSFYNSFTNKIS